MIFLVFFFSNNPCELDKCEDVERTDKGGHYFGVSVCQDGHSVLVSPFSDLRRTNGNFLKISVAHLIPGECNVRTIKQNFVLKCVTLTWKMTDILRNCSSVRHKSLNGWTSTDVHPK